jgi:hypothetical protein
MPKGEKCTHVIRGHLSPVLRPKGQGRFQAIRERNLPKDFTLPIGKPSIEPRVARMISISIYN